MLEICKSEIDSIMESLASQDMEEVSKQMEESEFAQTDLESELRFRKYLTLILKLNYISILLLQGGWRKETKTSFEDCWGWWSARWWWCKSGGEVWGQYSKTTHCRCPHSSPSSASLNCSSLLNRLIYPEPSGTTESQIEDANDNLGKIAITAIICCHVNMVGLKLKGRHFLVKYNGLVIIIIYSVVYMKIQSNLIYIW